MTDTIDAYAQVANLRRELRLGTATGNETSADPELARALIAASRSIDEHVAPGGGYRFAPIPAGDAGAGSVTRRIRVKSSTRVEVPPCHDLTLVEEDSSIAGSWSTIAATSYLPVPLDRPGWPVLALEAVGRSWCGLLRVTATWGWETTPPPVVTATLILAARLWKRGTTPEGVISGEFGAIQLRRTDPDVAKLLEPYSRMAFA